MLSTQKPQTGSVCYLVLRAFLQLVAISVLGGEKTHCHENQEENGHSKQPSFPESPPSTGEECEMFPENEINVNISEGVRLTEESTLKHNF